MAIESIIALIFGGIGTITGTIALMWNIFRERVKFEVIIEYPIVDTISKREREHIIRIMNKGIKPVQIEEVGFFLSSGEKTTLTSIEFSSTYTIGNGESKIHRVYIDKLKEHLAISGKEVVSVYARDSQNHISRGEIPDTMRKQLR